MTDYAANDRTHPRNFPEQIQVAGLGRNIQLGGLFDMRKGHFFAGISPWKAEDLDRPGHTKTTPVPSTYFQYSTSMEDRFSQNKLDVEGSISVSFGVVSVSGSANYLTEKKKSRYEARVGASCHVDTQYRHIVMEALSNVPYQRVFAHGQYTHFVAEVFEGGVASMSFTKKCSSVEEEQAIAGCLKGVVQAMVKVEGQVSLNFQDIDKELISGVEIAFSGDYDLKANVCTFEGAVGEAGMFPQRLSGCRKVLTATLLPVSLIDRSEMVVCRSISSQTLQDTMNMLKRLQACSLGLKDRQDSPAHFSMKKIQKQVNVFSREFEGAVHQFKDDVTRLLPLLKGGGGAEDHELLKTVRIALERCNVCEQYIARKGQEAVKIQNLIQELKRSGVEDSLEDGISEFKMGQAESRPSIAISIGSVDTAKHCLLEQLKRPLRVMNQPEDHDDSEEDGLDEEWCNNSRKIEYLNGNLCNFRELMTNNLICAFEARYCICKVSSIRCDQKIQSVDFGTVLVKVPTQAEAFEIIWPRAPVGVAVQEENLTVSWEMDEGAVVGLQAFRVEYKKLTAYGDDSDPEADGVVPSDMSAKPDRFVEVCSSKLTLALDSLDPGCIYCVTVRSRNLSGYSARSEVVIFRTRSKTSLAMKLKEFYDSNVDSERLVAPNGQSQPWALDNGKLVLGCHFHSQRFKDFQYQDELGNQKHEKRLLLQVADVAPSYCPDILAPEEQVSDVIILTGESGHGKSTHINAMVNWLCGVHKKDPFRLLLVDDRKAQGTKSITQHITIYRIRVFDGMRNPKNRKSARSMYLVDSPGYGDTRGLKYDDLITSSFKELFTFIKHIDCIGLVIKATESKCGPKTIAVITNILHLFGKDVGNNFLSIMTFADSGEPPATQALTELNVPVINSIKVNNAAFQCTSSVTQQGADGDAFDNLYWRLSKVGISTFFSHIRELSLTPCTTEQSANVTNKRETLKTKLSVLQLKMKNIVSVGSDILVKLRALEDSIGRCPSQKIEVTRDENRTVDIPPGVHITNCLICNFTCHENCSRADDDDKKHCCAMGPDGNCTVCIKRCHWSSHKNMKYKFVSVRVKEMITPEELIKAWAGAANTIEAAVLAMISKYLEEQDSLVKTLGQMHSLRAELEKLALCHQPGALVDYIEMMIVSAQEQNNVSEITILRSALQNIKLADALGRGNDVDVNTLHKTVKQVENELERRTRLTPQERVTEEDKATTWYDDVFDTLPAIFRQRGDLPKRFNAATKKFPEHLKKVIVLVGVILQTGLFRAVD